METNNLQDSGIDHHDTVAVTLDWSDPELERIIRIRFVGDHWTGLFDLSYCLGVDRQGRQVRVAGLPYQVSGGRYIRRVLVSQAIRDRVYLKRLCGGEIDDVLSVCF